jgi:hypothetical protein
LNHWQEKQIEDCLLPTTRPKKGSQHRMKQPRERTRSWTQWPRAPERWRRRTCEPTAATMGDPQERKPGRRRLRGKTRTRPGDVLAGEVGRANPSTEENQENRPMAARLREESGAAIPGATSSRTDTGPAAAQTLAQQIGTRRKGKTRLPNPSARRRTSGQGGAQTGEDNRENGGAVSGQDETHNPSARKKSQELGRALSREWNVGTERIHREKMKLRPHLMRSRTENQNRKMESTDPKRKGQEKR